MKNENQIAKEKRGFTTEVENNLFISKSDIELIPLLKSNNPKERTSSATILGQRKSEKAIFALCEQLKNEKALYSKIAISEALGKIGKPAINELVKYFGFNPVKFFTPYGVLSTDDIEPDINIVKSNWETLLTRGIGYGYIYVVAGGSHDIVFNSINPPIIEIIEIFEPIYAIKNKRKYSKIPIKLTIDKLG